MSIYKTATVQISLRDVCHYLVNESEGGRTANGIGVAIRGKPDLNGQIAAKLLDLYNNGSLKRTRKSGEAYRYYVERYAPHNTEED